VHIAAMIPLVILWDVPNSQTMRNTLVAITQMSVSI